MKYSEWLEQKKKEYEDFDPSLLNPEFIPYFESGDRIEVESWMGKKRGYVKAQRGHKPFFLLAYKRDAKKSGTFLTDVYSFVRIIPKKTK